MITSRRLITYIGSLFVFSLSFGVIQLNIISLSVPPTLFGYPSWLFVVPGITLIGLASWLSIIIRDRRNSSKALASFRDMVPVEAILEQRKARPALPANPVTLEHLGCQVGVYRSSDGLEAKYCWSLRGTSLSKQTLNEIYFSVSGTKPKAFADLMATCKSSRYSDKTVYPRLVKETPTRKYLALPLLGNGVDLAEPFDVQLEYVWEDAVERSRSDYFFFDLANYGHSVASLSFDIAFYDGGLSDVQHFEVDLGSGEVKPGMRIATTEGAAHMRLKKPSSDAYHVFLFSMLTPPIERRLHRPASSLWRWLTKIV